MCRIKPFACNCMALIKQLAHATATAMSCWTSLHVVPALVKVGFEYLDVHGEKGEIELEHIWYSTDRALKEPMKSMIKEKWGKESEDVIKFQEELHKKIQTRLHGIKYSTDLPWAAHFVFELQETCKDYY